MIPLRKFATLKGEDKDWAIRSAAGTLMEAEEVKADNALYKAALAHLKKEQEQRAKILKEIRGA